jgi:hypothetical protein
MLLPLKEKTITYGGSEDLESDVHITGKPVRLLFDPAIAPFLEVSDLRVGHTSYFAGIGQVPGAIFSKTWEEKWGNKAPKLDLPVVLPGYKLMVRVTNRYSSTLSLRVTGAWEMTTDPESIKTPEDFLFSNITSFQDNRGNNVLYAVTQDGRLWRRLEEPGAGWALVEGPKAEQMSKNENVQEQLKAALPAIMNRLTKDPGECPLLLQSCPHYVK